MAQMNTLNRIALIVLDRVGMSEMPELVQREGRKPEK